MTSTGETKVVHVFFEKHQLPKHKPSWGQHIFARVVPREADSRKVRRSMRKLAIKFFGPNGTGYGGYKEHRRQHDLGTCPCQMGEE